MTNASEEGRGIFSEYMTTVSHRSTSSEFTCDVFDAIPFYSAAQAGGRERSQISGVSHCLLASLKTKSRPSEREGGQREQTVLHRTVPHAASCRKPTGRG